MRQSANVMPKVTRLRIAAVLATVCDIALLFSVAMPAIANQAIEERAKQIAERLLAPCCWREALSVHRSPTADSLRAEIAKQVSAGQSNEQIELALIREHGKRILREPAGSLRGWLYIVPLVALAGGLVLLAAYIRQRARSAASYINPCLPIQFRSRIMH